MFYSQGIEIVIEIKQTNVKDRVAKSIQPSSGQNFQSLQTFLKIL